MRFTWSHSEEFRGTYTEELAITYLFTTISSSTLDMLNFPPYNSSANNFYRLRNTIAHGARRDYRKQQMPTNEQWVRIVNFSIVAVEELFTQYDRAMSAFDYC